MMIQKITMAAAFLSSRCAFASNDSSLPSEGMDADNSSDSIPSSSGGSDGMNQRLEREIEQEHQAIRHALEHVKNLKNHSKAKRHADSTDSQSDSDLGRKLCPELQPKLQKFLDQAQVPEYRMETFKKLSSQRKAMKNQKQKHLEHAKSRQKFLKETQASAEKTKTKLFEKKLSEHAKLLRELTILEAKRSPKNATRREEFVKACEDMLGLPFTFGTNLVDTPDGKELISKIKYRFNLRRLKFELKKLNPTFFSDRNFDKYKKRTIKEALDWCNITEMLKWSPTKIIQATDELTDSNEDDLTLTGTDELKNEDSAPVTGMDDLLVGDD